MKKILIAISFTMSLNAWAQENVKYDINDPRNPDCPCHKYQKLADEEYKKLMASAENKKISNKNAGRDSGISEAERKADPHSGKKSNDGGISVAENKNKEQGISDAEKKLNKNGVSDAGNERGISANDKNGNDQGVSEAEQIQRDSKGNISGSDLNKSSASSSTAVKSKSHSYQKKHRKKRKTRKYPSWLRKLDYHNWDICKESRIVSACFHWH